MQRIYMTEEQGDAVIAGLRLLQCAMENRVVVPNDGDVGDILTNSGKHAGLTVEQIDYALHDWFGLGCQFD